MARAKKRRNVFEKEEELLKTTLELSESEKFRKDPLLDEYKKLSSAFSKLLDEAILITSVSDRLQNKLNRAHDKLQAQSEEINKINTELAYNNEQLQKTVDELTKVRVSRRAATYVIVLAMILFLVSEGLIEPHIEAQTDNALIGLSLKLLIALIIKPIEAVVEKLLMKRAANSATKPKI